MITEFGFVRIGAGVPAARAGAVRENVASLTALAEQAEQRRCDLSVYPELCVTAYTCGDLFHQKALLAAARGGLSQFIATTAGGHCVHVVGLPLVHSDLLFNCAVAIQDGRILGVVPKTFIPGYKEYYEPRWFVPATAVHRDEIELCG